jgi:U6 snRNA-associated Sm-like protein LSm8
MRGTDQSSNVILEKCTERIFSSEGTEVVPIGLFLLRGDNV